MISTIKNATYLSQNKREFTNSETGEVRVYYKATFVQDDCEPLTLNIDESLFGMFEKFASYDLDLEINSYNGRFSCKVIDCAAV